MQRRDDRGPRVDVRGQQVNGTNQNVGQRGLARLDLTDQRDRGFKTVEFALQRLRALGQIAKGSNAAQDDL